MKSGYSMQTHIIVLGISAILFIIPKKGLLHPKKEEKELSGLERGS